MYKMMTIEPDKPCFWTRKWCSNWEHPCGDHMKMASQWVYISGAAKDFTFHCYRSKMFFERYKVQANGNLNSPIWRWLRVLPPIFFHVTWKKGPFQKRKGRSRLPTTQHFSGGWYSFVFGEMIQGRSDLGRRRRRSGGGFHRTENAHFHGANLGPLGVLLGCLQREEVEIFQRYPETNSKFPPKIDGLPSSESPNDSRKGPYFQGRTENGKAMCFFWKCWWDFFGGQCLEENVAFRTKLPPKSWEQLVKGKRQTCFRRLNLQQRDPLR